MCGVTKLDLIRFIISSYSRLVVNKIVESHTPFTSSSLLSFSGSHIHLACTPTTAVFGLQFSKSRLAKRWPTMNR